MRPGMLSLLILLGMVSLTSVGATQPAARLVLERDLRIDGNGADLVPIAWMGVGRNGMIAVVQAQDYCIRFFDRAGVPVAKVGRFGTGPGEFESVNSAGWKGDTLWVSDSKTQRLTFVSPEGTYARSIDFGLLQLSPAEAQRLPLVRNFYPRAVYSDGTLLATAYRVAVRPLPTVDPPPTAFLRVKSDGGVVRLVTWTPPRTGGSVRYEPNRPGMPRGGFGSLSVPFYAEPLEAIGAQGNTIAQLTTTIGSNMSGNYRVTILDANADTLFSRSYPFTGVPIPRAAIDSALQNRLPGDANRIALIARARALVPAVYPPVEALFIGRDDRIWVGLRPTSEGRRWIVLSPSGNIVGSAIAPSNVFLQTADAVNAWGFERDRDNVESIVRFRVMQR